MASSITATSRRKRSGERTDGASAADQVKAALHGLSAIQGVTGVFLVNDSGTLLAHDESSAFHGKLSEAAPKLSGVIASLSESLPRESATGFVFRFRLFHLVARRLKGMSLFVAARTTANLAMLQVGFRVAELKLSRTDVASAGPVVAKSQKSPGQAPPVENRPPPPDAVGAGVVEAMRACFGRYMGPSANLLLKREMTNLKVTDDTLGEKAYVGLVAKISRFIRDVSKRDVFASEAHAILSNARVASIEKQRDELLEFVEALHKGIEICTHIVKPVGGFAERHEAEVQQRLTEFVTSFGARYAERSDGLSETFLGLAGNLLTIQSELNLAGEVQGMLTPGTETLEHPAATIASHFRPSSQVGGDWWTVRELSGGRLMVMIADVTGHGLSCGIMTGVARAACDIIDSPAGENMTCAELLQWMNRTIYAVTQKRLMITCAASIIDAANSTFSIASAGHNFPYLIRNQEGKNKLYSLLARGTPLGVEPEPQYETTTFELARGDVVVWYTDGATECTNDHNEQFGDKRFRRLLAASDISSANKVRDAIFQGLHEFSGDKPLDDDLTFVVASIGGG